MVDGVQFAVVAIPLARPGITQFMLPPTAQPRGARVTIFGQRPTLAAEARWRQRLVGLAQPTTGDLLAIEKPQNHLVETYTDRLVPTELLAEPEFLTRNLGGWLAIYFGVMGWHPGRDVDPLLDHAVTLAHYGSKVRYFGANAAQVAARLQDEIEVDPAGFVRALQRLHFYRPGIPAGKLTQETLSNCTNYIEMLYVHIATGQQFAYGQEPPIPDDLLLDELMGWLVRLELARRDALARQDFALADAICAWQEQQVAGSGLLLLLKGEYIVGRHRRSTVLIAPELGVVVKQPGPEPFHEIALGAQTVAGQPENWPYLTHDKSVVTPRGRIRLLIEQNLIPRLHRTFRHPLRLSTLLGMTIEPFVVGKTVQQLVLEDPAFLTPQLYELFVLHQQVAEAIGVENGDWHSANFVRRDNDGEIVHIDWGAGRPLRVEEMTPAGQLARLNQVQNIAFSFHDPELAARTTRLHEALMADPARLAGIRRRAAALLQESRA